MKPIRNDESHSTRPCFENMGIHLRQVFRIARKQDKNCPFERNVYCPPTTDPTDKTIAAQNFQRTNDTFPRQCTHGSSNRTIQNVVHQKQTQFHCVNNSECFEENWDDGIRSSYLWWIEFERLQSIPGQPVCV